MVHNGPIGPECPIWSKMFLNCREWSRRVQNGSYGPKPEISEKLLFRDTLQHNQLKVGSDIVKLWSAVYINAIISLKYHKRFEGGSGERRGRQKEKPGRLGRGGKRLIKLTSRSK